MISSWSLFFLSVFVGYFLCHFIIAPMLLKKYRNRGFLESSFWESLQAENHLKDLRKETNDPIVSLTLKTIHYSKFVIGFAITAAIVFSVLNSINQ